MDKNGLYFIMRRDSVSAVVEISVLVATRHMVGQ